MLSTFIKSITALAIFIFSSYAKTVGIIQIIEHPALDATRQGLINTLQKTNPDHKIIWRSAQGNMIIAVQLAQNLVGQNVDIVIALGTASAQAAVKTCQGTNIPVVFASVTDPESAGLLGKAYGVSNFVEVDRQIKSIQQILPNLKKLGIIYNPGEANSDKLLQLTRAACKQYNIYLDCAVALKPADVVVATQKLASKVDAIFINNDNTALAAFPSVVRVADKTKTPVFASDADAIKSGALAVLGPDQYKIGIQTAELTTKILAGDKNLLMAQVVYPDSVDLYINQEKMKFFGLAFDPTLRYGE